MTKQSFIKVRVEDSSKERYLKAATAGNTDLSTVIRAALDRFAARVEKKDTTQ